MEPHNTGQFRVGLGAGAPNTIQPQTSVGPPNGEMRSSSTEGSTTGDESSDSDTVKGREYRGSTKQQGLLYVPIPDTKEERKEQIHYEPQAVESVHKMHQIQDDDPETNQRVSQERAMGRPDGYQIGILPRSDASQAQVFPAFSIQGEGLPVQDSSFWPVNGSENVHSMHTANTSLLPQARDNAVPLSRQRISPGRHFRPGQNKWPDRSQVAPRPRLRSKSGEMQLRTNASVHAPVSDMEHKDDDAIATSAEGSSDSETSSTCSTSLGADKLCEYCLTTPQAAIATATVVAEAALQRSIGHVQNHAYNGGSMPQSRMVALLQVASQEYSQAFSPRSRNDRCFDEGLRQRMQLASLSRRMAREQGQRHAHKSPRTRDRLEGVQQVRVRDKRESNLVSDRQLNSGSLPNERRRNKMSAAGPASPKDSPKVSQGQGDPDPSIPEGHCEPSSRRPLEESESPGMEPVHLSMPQVVQDDGTTSGRSVCEQSNIQSCQILQHGSDGQASNWQRWGQGEVATRTPICLPTTTHDPTDARAVEANGRRTDTDHSVLAGPVLVSRGNTDGRLTPKVIQATQVATNECDNRGGDSESDGIDQIDCVEALYRLCRREGLSNEATKRVLARWHKSTQAGYRPAWNDWCAFRRKEGLPVLQVCVKD